MLYPHSFDGYVGDKNFMKIWGGLEVICLHWS